MRILIYINFQVSFRVISDFKRGLEIKHFQLTKYKIFLANFLATPARGPAPWTPYHFLILSRCLDALSGFEDRVPVSPCALGLPL